MKIVFLFILLGGIFLSVFLAGQRTGFFSKASTEGLPDEIVISNVTESSFTVSWYTKDKAQKHFLSWGESESLGKTALDDRDGEQIVERFTHHVSLSGLKSSSEYFFKIGSASHSTIYKQKTAEGLGQNSSDLPQTLFGRVENQADKAVEDAVVYVINKNSQLLSVPVRSGVWAVNFKRARVRDLTSYFKFEPMEEYEIFTQSGTQGSSYVRMYGYAQSVLISLAKDNVPFFKVKLGGLKFGDFGAQRVESSPSPRPSNTPQASVSGNGSQNFFQTLWLKLKGK